MATAAQITAETWWQREIVTAELDWLGDEICRRLGRPRTAVGTKGNTVHLNGSHRSQEWLKNSAYCTNRTYTAQSGLTATQARHIAGVDIVPGDWGTAENRRLVSLITGRLLAAMKAGLLDEVLELYGTLDGRTVTGWNNPGDRVATSDLSHLDHPHLGLDRRHLTNMAFMRRLVAVIFGDPLTLERILSMGMQVLAKDMTTGKIWLCDGMTRRVVAPNESDRAVKDLQYLAQRGAISLSTSESPGGETKGGIWQGVSDLLGVPLAGTPTVDVAALATAIVAKLPATSLTAADVRAVLADVLLHGAAPTG